jgi:heat shock protein HslJ
MTGSATLDGSAWRLEALVEGGQRVPVLAGTEVTLEFFGKNVGGSAGCNRYNATYSIEGDHLSVMTPRQTRMICPTPAGVMEQEGRFLSALQAVSAYRLADDRLELLGAAGTPICVFARAGQVPTSQPM